MKKLLIALLSLGVLAGAATTAFAQTKKEERKAKKAGAASMASSDASPKSVLHVITVTWKADTKPEQIQAALEGAHKLTTTFPGVQRVWTRTIKAQGERTHVIAMEFKDEQALKDYAGSDAQKEWYKAYEGIRDRSTTFDVTN